MRLSRGYSMLGVLVLFVNLHGKAVESGWRCGWEHGGIHGVRLLLASGMMSMSFRTGMHTFSQLIFSLSS